MTEGEGEVEEDVGTVYPVVGVIVPAHNAAAWLDECLGSVEGQTYRGRMLLSVYDDASSDGTEEVLARWERRLLRPGRARVEPRFGGSRWVKCGGSAGAVNLGCGGAKNAAVRQVAGEVECLCFLDADDAMEPERVERQVVASRRWPRAIVGARTRRVPEGSTPHYVAWANGLDAGALWTHAFREVTLLMPTWFMRTEVFHAVGGFSERRPEEGGEGEDLIFFHAHLLRWAKERASALLEAPPVPPLPPIWESDPPLVLVGGEPLVRYRWSEGSGSSKASRRFLIGLRTAAFEARVLALHGAWARGFRIWGSGRDGRHFLAALSGDARTRVACFIDVAGAAIGQVYHNHTLDPPVEAIPIMSAEQAEADPATRGLPCVVCVSLRRHGDEVRKNVDVLGLVEGHTLWFFV